MKKRKWGRIRRTVLFLLLLTACFFACGTASAATGYVRHTTISGKKGWYYFENGEYKKNFTGVVKTRIGIRRIRKGRVDFRANGLYSGSSGTYLFRRGKVRTGFSGLYKKKWVIRKGKFRAKYHGVYRYKSGLWLIRNGMVREQYCGICKWHNKYYRVVNGKLTGKGYSSRKKLKEAIRNEILRQSSGEPDTTGAIQGIGGYRPSSQSRKALMAGVRQIRDRGYSTGFMMIDLRTGKGVQYNADQGFYVASSIKGIFIAAVAEQNPAVIRSWQNSVYNILWYSDNDAYRQMYRTLGNSYMSEWCRRAGARQDVANHNYCFVTSRELCRLWIENYKFFTGSDWGRTVGSWYTRPNLSPIHYNLSWKTQTKAGWICMGPYHAANDAGIVYASGGPYVVAIMSNADANLSLLVPLVKALDECHTAMVK